MVPEGHAAARQVPLLQVGRHGLAAEGRHLRAGHRYHEADRLRVARGHFACPTREAPSTALGRALAGHSRPAAASEAGGSNARARAREREREMREGGMEGERRQRPAETRRRLCRSAAAAAPRRCAVTSSLLTPLSLSCGAGGGLAGGAHSRAGCRPTCCAAHERGSPLGLRAPGLPAGALQFVLQHVVLALRQAHARCAARRVRGGGRVKDG